MSNTHPHAYKEIVIEIVLNGKRYLLEAVMGKAYFFYLFACFTLARCFKMKCWKSYSSRTDFHRELYRWRAQHYYYYDSRFLYLYSVIFPPIRLHLLFVALRLVLFCLFVRIFW